MCILFALQNPVGSESEILYVIAENRDEFLERPALPAHSWGGSNIFAGQDLTAKGTWLGFTATANEHVKNSVKLRFAILTNKAELLQRKERQKYKVKKSEVVLSRGHLVTGFLKSEKSSDFFNQIVEDRHCYPGFHLFMAERDKMYIYHDLQEEVKLLEPGVYGLSNGYLDENWRKIDSGKAQLKQIVSSFEAKQQKLNAISIEPVLDELLALLSDNRKYNSEEEKIYTGEFINKTAIFVEPFPVEHAENRLYGTRYQTAFIVTRKGEIFYKERFLDHISGKWTKPTFQKLHCASLDLS